MATPATRESPVEAPRGDADPRVLLSRRILADLLGPPEERGVRVEYWDGSVDPPSEAPATLRLNWPGALRRMLLPPSDLAVGEAYMRGDIDFVGDVETAIRSGWDGMQNLGGIGNATRLFLMLRRLPARRERVGSTTGDGQGAARQWRRRQLSARRKDALAVRFHYDLGNTFFRLFLDRRMQYSCAYFAQPRMELEAAQEAKLDLICRKLRLRPDERFLDVGCGWGGLVIHAARHYGVRATGITLSEAQAEWARREVAKASLQDRCRIELRDYRDLAAHEPFDKVASVGMIEHVGLGHYADYFRAVYDAVRPGGLFLNHGIVHLHRGHTSADRLRLRLGRRSSFIHRYIFPGSDLVPLGRTLAEAERVGFETRDVESLREHYARTLREWVERLDHSWDEAVRVAGEATTRAWRFYMAASAHLFAAGHIGIVQSLLAKADPRGVVAVPPTREDLYQT